MESRNYHDILFRVVEVGVALWFPCVLWNVNRPEQLWILNPKKILKTAAKTMTENQGEQLCLCLYFLIVSNPILSLRSMYIFVVVKQSTELRDQCAGIGSGLLHKKNLCVLFSSEDSGSNKSQNYF